MQTKVRKSENQESVINDEVRVFTDFPVPCAAHQGDITLVSLPHLPSGKSRSNRQVADSNTQGSRHVLEKGDLYDCDKEEVVRLINEHYPYVNITAQYIGPVFTSPAYLAHPEHGDHDYQCEGIIAVTYQMNVDAEERAMRARD